MRRVLFDTAVFLYARGTHHAYREPCRELVQAVASGAVVAEASAELGQEYAHARLRRGAQRRLVARETQTVLDLCLVHPLERVDPVGAIARLTS